MKKSTLAKERAKKKGSTRKTKTEVEAMEEEEKQSSDSKIRSEAADETEAQKGKRKGPSFYESFYQAGTCEVASRTRARTGTTQTSTTTQKNTTIKKTQTKKQNGAKRKRVESSSSSSVSSSSGSGSESPSESFADDSSDEELLDLKTKRNYKGPTKMSGNRVKGAAVIKDSPGLATEISKNPEKLINRLVAVFWRDVQKTYVGIVKSWNPKKMRHIVYYYHDKQTVKHKLRGKEWCWCLLENLPPKEHHLQTDSDDSDKEV
eukprot:TRINITY_DN4254_c0_g1_i1.p1 TRINITY_DN4254_c0_g1~~TRINITY_DN4254_c0_g1_i1.p1  ORF type:complete len:262 (-),score=48.77 TRINITY_DN4254_c0_g1_i1:54-839(-)